MNRLNILISTHELSPYLGSECAVGWNIVTRLGKYHNITVLYAKSNQFGTQNYFEHVKNYIENYGEITGVKFIEISQPKSTVFISKINSFISKNHSIGFPPLYFLGYRLWQNKAYKVAVNLLAKEKFDIIHHLTSISFREPGSLWKINIPFIWGPCSGISNIPFSYLRENSFTGILIDFSRYINNNIIKTYSIKIHKVVKTSSLIYCVSKSDFHYFDKLGHKNIKLMIETGTNVQENAVIIEKRNIIKILWIGRIDFYKGLHIFLQSLLKLSIDEYLINVEIVGEGPLKSKYEKFLINYNLPFIKFIGILSQKEVFERLAQDTDILVHTSFKEGTPHVILEALSCGVPVICHDAFGMTTAIDDKSGIKIPLSSPNISIDGFKNAILHLINHPEELQRLKEGAINRAKELSWDSMTKKIAEDYNSIALTKSK